ncbi:MAG: hypothetical protein SPL12_10665 [Bacteroidales bacterium]|nr:hypothetical protein [Bacteroidales bacterium]
MKKVILLSLFVSIAATLSAQKISEKTIRTTYDKEKNPTTTMTVRNDTPYTIEQLTFEVGFKIQGQDPMNRYAETSSTIKVPVDIPPYSSRTVVLKSTCRPPYDWYLGFVLKNAYYSNGSFKSFYDNSYMEQ